MNRIDRSGLLALHEYNRYALDLVLETAARLSPEELSRPSSPSHGSTAGLLFHMLGTEYFFLALCQGQVPQAPPRSAGLPSLADLGTFFAQVGQARGSYLETVSGADLDEIIPVKIGRGCYWLPRWQLLAQALIHSAHHRGELSIVMTGLGAPLPTLDPILQFIGESGQEWLG